MNKKEKVEAYDKEAVTTLKNILESSAEGGSPYYYMIQVDGLKVVPRTSDISKFDSYELFMPNADELILYIYASPNTPNYLLKRTFHTQPIIPASTAQSLNGVELEGIINSKVNQAVTLERERNEREQLQKELAETKAKLAEAEEYVGTLETQLQHYKSKKLHLGDINLGELASVVVEGMIRRNPQMLSKLPGGNALAGIIIQDNKEKEENGTTIEEQGEATFTKQKPVLTEEEQRYIDVIRQMEESFDPDELQQVMGIIQHLSAHTHKIQTVAELLDLTTQQTENHEKI